LEVYKKGAMAKVNQAEVTGDEGCGQPPPSPKAPDRASLPQSSSLKTVRDAIPGFPRSISPPYHPRAAKAVEHPPRTHT